jgi:hypothetical protein
MPNRRDFDRLMRAICAGYGYCGSLHEGWYSHVTDFIPAEGTVTADEFVDWVLLADREPTHGDPRRMVMRERLRSCFIGYLGSPFVNAKKLRHQRSKAISRQLRLDRR